MGQKDTKERILDAAEILFAEDGYHATSLRGITRKAEANLAAVNYHFGSKEELVAEVIKRRLVPLNELRTQGLMALIEMAEKEKSQPEVEAILRAFIETTLVFMETTPGANSFITLIGRALAEPDDTVRKIFIGLMEPVFKMMMQGLGMALPDYPKEVLFWRLHFMIGATSHTLRCIDKCPIDIDGRSPVENANSLVAMLLPFVTAGMEAPI
ncbi:MAG: TetR family transcriptional regulator [Proteobacteria bacterium]|nr:TetR family transcriptional regulator [Pseudomonadota bacterium]MBU1711334.1 TetR family transcriptional regulator [Pseudomonadota bacterium]